MKFFWKFMRYSHSLDLYFAVASGNREAARFARERIAECDQHLDLIGIQQ